MTEHSRNGNYIKPDLTGETAVYKDPVTGEITQNIVFKVAGEEFNLDKVPHGSSNSTVAFNIGSYYDGDATGRTLVFLDYGSSMVEFTFLRDGETTSTYHEDTDQLFAKLTRPPMTLGSRPGRLGDGKLLAAAIQISSFGDESVTPGKEGKRDPFMVAAQVQREALGM